MDADPRKPASSTEAELRAQIADLQQQVAGLERRINGLYDSRIWRALVKLARVFEFSPSRRAAAALPPAAAEALRCSLDEPTEGQRLCFGELIVRGWALAGGHSLIQARLNNGDWFPVSNGHARPDVALAFRQESEAERSGFLGRFDVRSLTPGMHSLALRISRADGVIRELRRSVRVDPAAATPAERNGGAATQGDQLRIRIEEPAANRPLYCGSSLIVSGWAVAESGIAKLDISFDGKAFTDAAYGRMREDIAVQYAGFADAAHSGFDHHEPGASLTAGRHLIIVRAESRGGLSAEARAEIVVEPRTAYELWVERNTPTASELERMRRQVAEWTGTHSISIVTPVFRTPLELLARCAASVQAQVYPHWEWILVDDGSADPLLTRALETLAASDPRIRLRTNADNRGIAAATNDAIELASGDYVAFLDHDDEIAPDALYRVADSLRQDSTADVLYSDEDKIDERGRRSDGFFKPAWSPDLLRSMNYICHLLVCRRALLKQAGGLREGFEGSQDYDLVLRLSEQTQNIVHLPFVLYHWRAHAQSTALLTRQKPAAGEAGRRALEQHVSRTGADAAVEETYPCCYRVRYALPQQARVSIIIPTAGSDKLTVALRSVQEISTFRDFEIILVDNSNDSSVLLQARDCVVIDQRRRPFNFSKLCNRGAQAASGSYLLFLNDDTAVITPDWIETLLEHAQRPEVGTVGPMLLFPNGTIQHAGVTMGCHGVAGHAFRSWRESAGPFYFRFSHALRDCAAVTGACLMTRREIFERFHGFDEANLPICFQDTDLCLRMAEAGLRNVYTPHARLYHFESATKRVITGAQELSYMQRRWARWIANDPFYNPNLSRRSDGFEVDAPSTM